MFDSVKNAYQNFSNSVDSFQRDMADIRDTFVGIKNVVGAIFDFMGQETAILLFCTFLFLFVVNLIPFLFVGKKTRYYIGIGFGLYLGYFFHYTLFAVFKFVLIMLLPVFMEWGLAWVFSKLWKLILKGLALLPKGLIKLPMLLIKKLRRCGAEAKKQPETVAAPDESDAKKIGSDINLF